MIRYRLWVAGSAHISALRHAGMLETPPTMVKLYNPCQASRAKRPLHSRVQVGFVIRFKMQGLGPKGVYESVFGA